MKKIILMTLISLTALMAEYKKIEPLVLSSQTKTQITAKQMQEKRVFRDTLNRPKALRAIYKSAKEIEASQQ